jgi:hypothetical protein
MGIKDLDLSGAVERMKIILPNLKNDQAQFDLKTIIDGLEAAESQVAALTASLASVTAKIESWKKEEIEWKNIEIDHASFRVEVEKKFAEMTAQRDTSLASLAELRKRMGEAEKALGRAVEYLKGFNGNIVTDVFITDHSFIVNNCDAEQDLGNVLRALASPPSPAPVESKPKEEFFCCKDQDNPCHPIRDYCSTGRARRAADTAKPSPSKP